jgi:hypothetical protein
MPYNHFIPEKLFPGCRAVNQPRGVACEPVTSRWTSDVARTIPRVRILTVMALTLTVGAVAAGAGNTGRTAAAAAHCNLWAAPYGADVNTGSQAKPFQTVAKLAAALAPGQTGCLAAGTLFPAREVITAVGAPDRRITITSSPGGPRAVLADGIETTQAARFLTLSNLAVGALENSPTKDAVSGTVVIRGYSTELRNSDVGTGGAKLGGRSCVVLDHAGAATIDGNVLHQCNGGTIEFYSAGILAAVSVRALITDNVIVGNASGDGIAFSPNAQVSIARRNLIVDNLGGVYFGGDAKTAPRDTLVEQNIIARSTKFGVHSGFLPNGPTGTHNLVRKNCIWTPGAPAAAGSGFTMGKNKVVNPRITQVQGSIRLAPPSSCRAYQPKP